MPRTWDLTALVNAADPKAGLAERHLWLVRLMEWLRHAPNGAAGQPVPEGGKTPLPVLRLRHLLNQIDRQPGLREKIHGMAVVFWRDIDAAALFADFGFGERHSLGGELLRRIGQHILPGTPQTRNLADLFAMMFHADDLAWVEALDDATLRRVADLLTPGKAVMRATLTDAINILVSSVHASGYAPALRQRMEPALRQDEPFRQLAGCAGRLRSALQEKRPDDALKEAAYLRALLDGCRRAADSVMPHLEQYGVSVNIVFSLDQLRSRTLRVEQLVDCLIAPDPVPEGHRLLASLVATLRDVRSLRALLAGQYSLLARQVAERSAETGEHYITRDRGEYREMLKRAAGGGAVLAGTTFIKFAVAALGMTVFWTGVWSGINYALSFVLVMLMHWTVATKQPAMTAPALAASLPAGGDANEEEIESFVDRVAQLIRSQAAAVFGNLMACGPLVLLVQLLATWLWGAPLVGEAPAHYSLHSLTVLGPTVLYAAFTGVLLFASSLIAGWAENWFVFHQLDSALMWNPRIVARLGAARAWRWGRWWRANVSGVAANVSLGLMLGMIPALAAIVGLPLEVRHVTLSTGQLGAALGALGLPLLAEPAFWLCMAGIAVTAVLNVSVSFWLAFKVALRSRGMRVRDRNRIRQALRRRLLTQPLSFFWPPRG